MALYADEILNKQPATAPKTTLSEITKGTMTGGLIGLIGGTVYAYASKKPYIKCMLIGALIGSAISAAFLVKK